MSITNKWTNGVMWVAQICHVASGHNSLYYFIVTIFWGCSWTFEIQIFFWNFSFFLMNTFISIVMLLKVLWPHITVCNSSYILRHWRSWRNNFAKCFSSWTFSSSTGQTLYWGLALDSLHGIQDCRKQSRPRWKSLDGFSFSPFDPVPRKLLQRRQQPPFGFFLAFSPPSPCKTFQVTFQILGARLWNPLSLSKTDWKSRRWEVGKTDELDFWDSK